MVLTKVDGGLRCFSLQSFDIRADAFVCVKSRDCIPSKTSGVLTHARSACAFEDMAQGGFVIEDLEATSLELAAFRHVELDPESECRTRRSSEYVGILSRCTYMCLNQNPLSHSYFAFNNFEGGVSTGSVRCQRLSSGQSGAKCSLPLREQPRAFRRSRTAFSACRSARKHVRRVKYTFSRENQVRYTKAQPPLSLCHQVDSDTAHCFERRSIVALN